MCGNFGLLLLKPGVNGDPESVRDGSADVGRLELDASTHQTMELVASTHGLRMETGSKVDPTILDVFTILEAQTAQTEIRGGQAGGISSLTFGPVPSCARVRCVARKRHPLSKDLANMQKAKLSANYSDVSIIGHTRFATSSINVEKELHPHEWSPLSQGTVYSFRRETQRLERRETLCGLHLSHNGDFDALHMYGETITVQQVGLWLEKVLHVPNLLRGDSPKLAGCMELFHVQGRWNRAARLAWTRTVLKASGDVCNGPLTRGAASVFPDETVWTAWARFLDSVWERHSNNAIKGSMGTATYTIDRKAENLLVRDLERSLSDSSQELRQTLRCAKLEAKTLFSFFSFTVRGFLRGDLYTALTELLARAEGSFGVQVHSPNEPGVVVVASKGQPMSIAFDKHMPLVLFGSEATALTVSVTPSGQWLGERVDLDSQGEVFRIGKPRQLFEGTFDSTAAPSKTSRMLLPSGIELRSYSLVRAAESGDFSRRIIPIMSVPLPIEEGADLVAQDIKSIPRVVEAIDKAWAVDKTSARGDVGGEVRPVSSAEAQTAAAFCTALLSSVSHREITGASTLDLVVTGVEVSLWMGEQFANDLRMIFPQINVVAISSNKLLGLGHLTPEKIFFPGTNTALEHQIDPANTVCLLISQSGQTFPTLHAAFSLAAFLARDNLFLLTGTFHSKIEKVIVDSIRGKDPSNPSAYLFDRVLNNYSGHRPAEPSSVASVATWHTLSHLLLFLAERVQAHNLKARESEGINVRGARSGSISSRDTSDVDCREVVMLLSDGCIGDLRSLLLENLTKNLEDITLEGGETNKQLEIQGKLWAAHLAEPWNILVFVGLYIILSVGLGLPIFGLLGDSVVAIIRAAGGFQDQPAANFRLSFSLRYPSTFLSQPTACTIVGAILQLGDALWFVFLAKIFTWGSRAIHGRALSARFGKRTIVVVDQPAVHQMVENFVSKLYSQAYSFVTPEVHGACPQDHFVHRFTHRVVRGLLIAVGRPDGRLGCLSKSENAVILATKQAAFIRNPEYGFEGSAPEIVTISHNPYVPSFHARHVVIKSTRRKFLEEVLYERLHQDAEPFTAGILRSMAQELISGDEAQAEPGEVGSRERLESGVDPLDRTNRGPVSQKSTSRPVSSPEAATPRTDKPSQQAQASSLPHGAHLIYSDIGSSIHGGSLHGRGLGASGHGGGLGGSVHGHPGLGLGASTHGMRRRVSSNSMVSSGGGGGGTSTSGSGGGDGHRKVVNLSTSTHGTPRTAAWHGLDTQVQSASPLSAPALPEPPIRSTTRQSPPASQARMMQSNHQQLTQQQPELEREVEDELTIGFFFNARESRRAQRHMASDLKTSLAAHSSAEMSDDPHARLIFSSRTDTTTREIQDQEHVIQSFYEDRVASLERFVSFCVLFASMAKSNSRPLLLPPWDYSRSQSYLRVATTASPVAAVESGGAGHSAAANKIARLLLLKAKGVESSF